jgi:deoxyinosine 3'endonuclease (endonuclease V)
VAASAGSIELLDTRGRGLGVSKPVNVIEGGEQLQQMIEHVKAQYGLGSREYQLMLQQHRPTGNVSAAPPSAAAKKATAGAGAASVLSMLRGGDHPIVHAASRERARKQAADAEAAWHDDEHSSTAVQLEQIKTEIAAHRADLELELDATHPGTNEAWADLVQEQTRARWMVEQERLKLQLRLGDDPQIGEIVRSLQAEDGRSWLVGGLDISFLKDSQTAAVASVVVVQLPQMTRVATVNLQVELTEPYIAGFLGFREVAHFAALLDQLRREQPAAVPQLLMVDGFGVLHHRGFGSACHVGVVVGIPTIGVGKELLLIDGLDRVATRQVPAHLDLTPVSLAR